MSDQVLTDVQKENARIVCAAIKHRGTGLIVLGARHFDMMMVNTIKALAQGNEESGVAQFANAEQGFVDQFGTFYNREDAFKIAERKRQFRDIPNVHGVLYSEDLY